MSALQIKIPRAQHVSDALIAIILLLIGLSLFGQCSKYLWGHPMLKGFVPMFYVDYEATAPTWYSSAALGLAGAILALIAIAKHKLKDRFRWHWTTLSILLFGLSADEIAMLHEMPIDPMREMFQFGGALYYAWVIPGAAFVVLVGVVYLRFMLNLPSRTRNLLIFSAVVFVSGAIGVEMLSGIQADQFGEENLDYALIVTIEEMLEMLGVVILVRALLDYIEREFGNLRLEFARN